MPLDSIDRDARTVSLLQKVNLVPPHCIRKLSTPAPADFGAPTSNSEDEARALLVAVRTSQPGYKPAAQKLRFKWSKLRREELSNPQNWKFNKHEIGLAFDVVMIRRPLNSPDIARILLSLAAVVSLDELWCHRHDPKLERRATSWFRLKRSKRPDPPEAYWLQDAVELENSEYVRLICHAGVDRQVLDRGLSVALALPSLKIAEILLSHGATVTPECTQHVKRRLQQDHDVPLTRLLLSCEAAMTAEIWQESLPNPSASEQACTIFLLCLAHRNDLASSAVLLMCLSAESVLGTTITLAYAPAHVDFSSHHDLARQVACSIEQEDDRLLFFDLLFAAKFLDDCDVLRHELERAVRLRQLRLIRILVDAHVAVNANHSNAFHLAVETMDREVLDILASGNILLPVSRALELVPDAATEADILWLLGVLGPHEPNGEPLDSLLVRAARRQELRLVEVLIESGASVDFDQCAAVRDAVQHGHNTVLAFLLRGRCSVQGLSTIVALVVSLTSRSDRLFAMQVLLSEHSLLAPLGSALSKLMLGDDQGLDYELIKLLLQHKAPVDAFSFTLAISLASRDGDVRLLDMVCQAKPPEHLLSYGVATAFETVGLSVHPFAFDAIRVLLRHGAHGLDINQTLVDSVVGSFPLDIIELLITRGANVNVQDGVCVVFALKSGNLELLKLLCNEASLESRTTTLVLTTAIDPKNFRVNFLDLLLTATRDPPTALNGTWGRERLGQNSHIASIVPCMLRYGLDVNCEEGVLLSYVVEANDLFLLTETLKANTHTSTLASGFKAVCRAEKSSGQLSMMTLLLERSGSVEIGQSEQLVQETEIALADGNTTRMETLLGHNADVNFDDGHALCLAAQVGPSKILNLLCHRTLRASSVVAASRAIARSALESHEKMRTLQTIIEASQGDLSTTGAVELLDMSVQEHPDSVQLPCLLLRRNVRVTWETMEPAMQTVSEELFNLLVRNIKNPFLIAQVFRHVAKAGLSESRRYWMYECLLKSHIPTASISQALVDHLDLAPAPLNLDIPKLLLQHRAFVGHKDGRAFQLASRESCHDLFRLLTQFITDSKTAKIASRLVQQGNLGSTPATLDTYRSLLVWDLDFTFLNFALVRCLTTDEDSGNLVQLLIRKGADPNQDAGHCFQLTIARDQEKRFRALCARANGQTLLGAIVKATHNEEDAVRWMALFAEERQDNARQLFAEWNFVFEWMTAFPRSASLRTFLQDGLPVDATKLYSLLPGWPAESCTIWLWAIFQRKKATNNAILTMLQHESSRLETDPSELSFKTKSTSMSAIAACVLYPGRTPILEAMLDINRSALLAYEMPAATFTRLKVHCEIIRETSDLLDLGSSVSLRMLALYARNIGAFRCLSVDQRTDDGMLHLATILLLPQFVEFLLQSYDPNEKRDEYDQMIPLAMVCICGDPSLRVKQKEIMSLLAPRTDLRWRHRNKSVLHIALDDGPETTKAMIEVLRPIPAAYARGLDYYTDKKGRRYNLVEYISDTELMEIDQAQRGALLSVVMSFARTKK